MKTSDEMLDELIKAGKEPRISHQPGDSQRGEYCVAYRSGHLRLVVRGHSLNSALSLALVEAGVNKGAFDHGDY